MQGLSITWRLLQGRSQDKNICGYIKSDEQLEQIEYQKTEEFINLQRKRYKIEAKNSELKNVLGYDRALSYGLSCMEMQGALTIFAANVKRIIKLMQNA